MARDDLRERLLAALNAEAYRGSWSSDRRDMVPMRWDEDDVVDRIIEHAALTAAAGTALRDWLLDQSRQAHYAADHPDGQPGDPGGYFDKGAAHMADATLTQLATMLEAAPDPGLTAEVLAVAMNEANIQPDELRLGRDLSVPAARILQALVKR